MTTNHQNHNQITNPIPQPHHHSPPTTGKRKEKQPSKITNPQPHHHQQSEKEKEKQPPRETHAELLADDPRRSTLNVNAHAGQRPMNPRRSETYADAHTCQIHNPLIGLPLCSNLDFVEEGGRDVKEREREREREREKKWLEALRARMRDGRKTGK